MFTCFVLGLVGCVQPEVRDSLARVEDISRQWQGEHLSKAVSVPAQD